MLDKTGTKNKARHLYHMMDAYMLGAVPPYSFLLGGKPTTMLACSNEVRNAFCTQHLAMRQMERS